MTSSRDNHEHGEPLEGHRLVAGEVRQVGADRQQQRVDPQLRSCAARPLLARGRDCSVRTHIPGRPLMLVAFFLTLVNGEPFPSPCFSAQSVSWVRSPT